MQTFLPYVSYKKSAKVLDNKRLGKQRVEAYQILCALHDSSYGWQHHPAVKMWRGFEEYLVVYGYEICTEWIRRGFKDSLLEKICAFDKPIRIAPFWMCDEQFHLSHRSNLIRKFPEHYRKFWPDVPDDLPYIWPAK